MLKTDIAYEPRRFFLGSADKVKREVISGYVESFDGTHIWFRKTYPVKKKIKSIPPLVLSNGIGTTIRYWRYVEDYISRITEVVVWDYRGHGRSMQPKTDDLSMTACAKDMKAVCDAAEISSAVFGGFSMGVQVILEFFRLYPGMVKGLIPALGPYEHPAKYFLDFPLSELILKITAKLVLRNPKRAQKIWASLMTTSFAFRLGKSIGIISERLFFLNPLLAHVDDFTEYFENLRKMKIEVFFKMALSAQEHSAQDVLDKINVPTLAIIGENDIFTPKYVMLRMAQKIKNSEVLILPKGSHGGLVEYAELVCLRIEKFLKDHFGSE
jgi:pimeloyl-ACP methyl ester carboxylesterase